MKTSIHSTALFFLFFLTTFSAGAADPMQIEGVSDIVGQCAEADRQVREEYLKLVAETLKTAEDAGKTRQVELLTVEFDEVGAPDFSPKRFSLKDKSAPKRKVAEAFAANRARCLQQLDALQDDLKKRRMAKEAAEVRKLAVSLQAGNWITLSAKVVTVDMGSLLKDLPVAEPSGGFDWVEKTMDVVTSVPGDRFLLAGSSRWVVLWDTQTGKTVCELDRGGEIGFDYKHRIHPARNGKTCFVECLRAGKAENSKNASGMLQYDLETSNILQSIVPTKMFFSGAIAPDEQTIYLSCNGGLFKHDLATSEQTEILPGYHAATIRVTDRYLVALKYKPQTMELEIFDRDTMKPSYSLSLDAPVCDFEPCPEGKLLLVGTTDRRVTIWDLDTKERLAELEGFPDDPSYVFYSPDKKFLAVMHQKEPFGIFDAETFRPVLRCPSGWTLPKRGCFSSDGKRFYLSRKPTQQDRDTANKRILFFNIPNRDVR